ncbi:MAG: serine/threonine transporter SstT [Coriobacteriales bacterium]|nr:serine/threonine transporter SstT [Coriobacteriales bacterium]
MNAFQKFMSLNIVARIAIGLAVGIVLALIFYNFTPQDPTLAEGFGAQFVLFINAFFGLLGKLFVSALKGIAPILVFFLVSNALCNMKTGHKSPIKVIIVFYLVGTFAAALLASIMTSFIPVNMVFSSDVDLSEFTPPSGIGEVLTTLLLNIVANPIDALANANFLGILFAAVLFGLALRYFATEGLRDALQGISDAISICVKWIINCAPIGVMGLVYSAIIDNGLSVFIDYGLLIVVLVVSMLIMFLVVNPLIVFIAIRENPYPIVLKCIARSAITAFFTRSSAANIPVNMELCKDLKLNKDTYSITIPLGATINMEGAAITISVLTLAACHTLGIQVDFISALVLSFLAALGACGASGVAGGSLLLIPMAASLFGISPDIAATVIGVGFIIGVIQDSLETALNSSTDALFTTVGEIWLNKKSKKAAESDSSVEVPKGPCSISEAIANVTAAEKAAANSSLKDDAKNVARSFKAVGTNDEAKSSETNADTQKTEGYMAAGTAQSNNDEDNK